MSHRKAAEALVRSMRGPSAKASPDSEPHPSRGIHSTSSFTSKAKTPDSPPRPSPSASILLISPTNRILLLHRVAASTSFASAHVFPGGHVDGSQDGPLPPVSDPKCHEDSEPYRMAALRECFEESGLLLAYRKGGSKGELVTLDEREREEGRKAIHSGKASFKTWVSERGGEPDVDGLIPFTRWLTPANILKRFSTQMYLYLLPLETSVMDGRVNENTSTHIPTPDNGIEHTAASFLYPSEWLTQSLNHEIVLFPPQFFLLSLVADYLFPPPPTRNLDSFILQDQRNRLMEFVKEDGNPPWGEKCISPDPINLYTRDGVMIMGLADPGPELEGTGRRGDGERVILVELDEEVERGRQRPRPRDVVWKRDWERGKLKGMGKL